METDIVEAQGQPVERPQEQQSAEEQRVVSVADLDTLDIRPGDRITGIESLADLDAFVNKLAVKLTGHRFDERLSKRRIANGLSRPVMSLSAHLKKYGAIRKFYGNIHSFDIGILPPEPEDEPAKIIRFYARADMDSTGRGKIGDLESINGVYVNGSGGPSLITRPVNTDSLSTLTGRLLAESRLASYVNQAQAVGRVVSGGLPGLGKP
jgi:hypothetical protein